MLFAAIASLVASAAMCYLIGTTVVAPRDSWIRSKRGMWILIVAALSIVTLPPSMPLIGSSTSSLGEMGAGLAASLAWPESLPTGAYLAVWIVTSIAAVLVGARVWKAGKPGWRDESSNAWDSSASGRAAGILPLADSLTDALDVLVRTKVDAKTAERLGEPLRSVGHRFAAEVPEDRAAAYRLVAGRVPPAVAAVATRFLLEGAAQRRAAGGD